MTQGKFYRFPNGIVFETEAELKAYIRGLEMARSAADTSEGYDEFQSKTAAALDYAHSVKAAGPWTEEEWAEWSGTTSAAA